MIESYPDLPEWLFEMDEVSAGVYEVSGKDKRGHMVHAKGTDFDALLDGCRKRALALTPASRENLR